MTAEIKLIISRVTAEWAAGL